MSTPKDSEIKIQNLTTRLTSEEQETIINISFPEGGSRLKERNVIVDTTVMSDYNKFKKLGWKQVGEYRLADDGTVLGGTFEVAVSCVQFRNANSKKTARVYTEEEKAALRERLARVRENKKS